MIKQPPIEKNQSNLSFQDQGINIDKLNRILGETALTPEEERIFIWLSELETSTIDTIISVMKKVSWPNSHTDHLTYSDLSILCKKSNPEASPACIRAYASRVSRKIRNQKKLYK